MSEYTYQPDDIEMIKHQLHTEYGLSLIVKKEDLNRVDEKHLIYLYEHKGNYIDNINGFQSLFIMLTGILPTQAGGYYLISRSAEGFYSWGMINLSVIKPNLVWIPEKHYTYHRDRLASGLIAITPTNI